MDKIKLIIAGSRTFTCYPYARTVIDNWIAKHSNDVDIEIVSGGARGADRLGERYAREHDLSYRIFPAQWDKYGKSAGYKRNEQMAEYADCLIAFHQNGSRGTQHMINIANNADMNVTVINL
ncbi:MAG: hypothetical protein CMF19_03935 [Idiomarinaceae bacterium]|nr:hypothetical protein [Idiomarinaceae bacterium]